MVVLLEECKQVSHSAIGLVSGLPLSISPWNTYDLTKTPTLFNAIRYQEEIEDLSLFTMNIKTTLNEMHKVIYMRPFTKHSCKQNMEQQKRKKKQMFL